MRAPTRPTRAQLHVAYVSFVGLRVGEDRMLELGMTLPGLASRLSTLKRLPALGLLTLAGMTPEAWDCSYHEVDQDSSELAALLIERRPTLVAISALSASIDEAYALSRILRAAGVRVVLGGLHVSACPNEARQHCDAVVIGEGEPVWHDVLEDARTGQLRARYRARRAFDLAESPVPRFDLLGPEKRPRAALQTQRGCPLGCEFCGASRLLGPFREKPLSQIQRELAELERHTGASVLELADDNSFSGKRNVTRLLDTLQSAGVRYFTESDWRVGERPEVLSGLSASGCVQLLVGIESVAFRHRGMGPKHADISRIMEAVCAIQEAGVAVNGCFIIGADGETRASIERLGEFVVDSPLADVQLTIQTPFPGTRLYTRLKREKRLRTDSPWSRYSLFDVVYEPDMMPADELALAFCELVKTIFSCSQSARRAALRHRIWRRAWGREGSG